MVEGVNVAPAAGLAVVLAGASGFLAKRLAPPKSPPPATGVDAAVAALPSAGFEDDPKRPPPVAGAAPAAGAGVVPNTEVARRVLS